jgi:hypothetical protein
VVEPMRDGYFDEEDNGYYTSRFSSNHHQSSLHTFNNSKGAGYSYSGRPGTFLQSFAATAGSLRKQSGGSEGSGGEHVGLQGFSLSEDLSGLGKLSEGSIGENDAKTRVMQQQHRRTMTRSQTFNFTLSSVPEVQCIYTLTRKYTYTHTCIHLHTLTHTCTRKLTYTYTALLHTYTNTQTHKHTLTHAHCAT